MRTLVQRALIFSILSSPISFGDNYLDVIEGFSIRRSPDTRRSNGVARATTGL
jgi:hypothetical protein